TLIPAAGFGTRMLPAAKAVPKEMLPVLNVPVIQYVVQELADAGCDDVLLVVSDDKKAIEDHFDRRGDLERRLDEKGKRAFVASVDALMAQVQVFSVRQREQLGLGHAVLQGKRHVGNEPFICALGDTIFSGGTPPSTQLIEAHQRLGGSVVALERVPKHLVSRYGVAAGEMGDDTTIRVSGFVEKPAPDAAPSDLAIAARYLLSPTIFDLLEDTKPGKGGEIQLTDALQRLCEIEPVHGVVLDAQRHDIGNPTDWLKTNLIHAAHDDELRAEIAPLVRELFGV
ncbi:MAG: UTP--glucose-1-phosphate uridylyltransferase, partial [Planctomycetota bacterium]